MFDLISGDARSLAERDPRILDDLHHRQQRHRRVAGRVALALRKQRATAGTDNDGVGRVSAATACGSGRNRGSEAGVDRGAIRKRRLKRRGRSDPRRRRSA